MATAPRKRPTRSKTQLKDAMTELKEQLGSQEAVDPTTAAATERRKEEVRRSIASLAPDTIVAHLGNIGMQAQGALDVIKNLMVSSQKELDTIQEAIEIEKAELEQLHGKEVAAASLADLIAEFDQKTAELEASYNQRSAEFGQRITEQQKTEGDRRQLVEQARKREEDEYLYGRNQRRRADEDAFNQKMLTADREAADKFRELSANWTMRENELRAKESDYKNALIRIDGLPAEVAAEVKKATESQARAMSNEYAHKAAMAEAQAKSDKALADAEIKSLKEKLAAYDILIASQNAKLDAAEKRVESIANNALTSASGRQALEASTQMAATLKSDGSSRKS